MKKRTHTDLTADRLTEDQARQAVRHPVVVILADIRSLYNVGSILRTCDAMLVSDVVLAGYTPPASRPEIAKTALGAERTVPWRHAPSAVEAIHDLRQRGWTVLAVELAHGARPVTALGTGDYPLALVFGNELTGIAADVLDACDGAVEIPMFGVKHSLNVAVAAGIALHQAVLGLHRQAVRADHPR